jgi:putative ABC transport system permease protein
VVLAAAGAAALAVGVSTDDGSSAATAVGLGALTLVLATVTLSPVLAGPFLRTVGAVLPRVWGRTGHLARENAVRNPRRTAATASALMIGLALVSAFSIIGSSTNASLDRLIGTSLGADYVVSTAVGQPFTPEVAQRLRDVDGIAAVNQQRFGSALVGDEQLGLTAADAGTLDAALRFTYVDGGTAGLADGGLLVEQSAAEQRGWAVGEPVELVLNNGQRLDLAVGGVYESNPAVGALVVDLAAYEAAGGPALDQYVYLDLAPDADRDAVRSDLETTLADYPVVTLKDQTEFADEQKGQIDQLLLLINALLVLSLLIAVLGIVNTLALSVVERTREIGLLRAIGMGRPQLRRMVRLESVVISVYGAVLGLALGTVFGVSLVRALRGQGIEILQVPYGRMAVFLLVAAVVGVLAAVWPARRAARMDVLSAISTA